MHTRNIDLCSPRADGLLSFPLVTQSSSSSTLPSWSLRQIEYGQRPETESHSSAGAQKNNLHNLISFGLDSFVPYIYVYYTQILEQKRKTEKGTGREGKIKGNQHQRTAVKSESATINDVLQKKTRRKTRRDVLNPLLNWACIPPQLI